MPSANCLLLVLLPQLQEGPSAIPRGDRVDTHHGIEVVDPYRGLESASAERSRWVAAEDAQTLTAIRGLPEYETYLQRMTALRQITRPAPVRKAGDRFFLARPRAGDNFNHVQILPADASSPRILVDAYGAGPDRADSFAGPMPDPEGYLVVYGAGDVLRVFDVDGEEQLAGDALPASYDDSGVAWAPEGAGFYYVHGMAVRYHAVATLPADDVTVYSGRTTGSWRSRSSPTAATSW